MVPNSALIEKDVRVQSLLIHILQGPCKEAPPLLIPFAELPQTEMLCFQSLSRVPGKRTPPPGSPTGPIWRKMLRFQSQWFIHSFTSLRVPS